MWKSVLLAIALTTAALWYDTAPPLIVAPHAAAPSSDESYAARGPTVSLAITQRDLGRTTQPNLWEAAFPVRNIGGRRLVINQLDTACDCGERSLRTFLVAPGETVDLIVTLDTRLARGEAENVASFTTNDPQLPRFDLTLRTFVAAPAVDDGES